MERAGRHIDRKAVVQRGFEDLMVSLNRHRLIVFRSISCTCWMIERVKYKWLLILYLISWLIDLIEYYLFLWYDNLIMTSSFLKILGNDGLRALLLHHLEDLIFEYLIWCRHRLH